MTAHASNWTAARIETLAELWKNGLNASEIAAAMGGVSRNAVMGKVDRLGLPARRTPGLNVTFERKRPWTEQDSELLRAAVLEGLDARQAAERVKRTPAACDRQARKMGLKLIPADRTVRKPGPAARLPSLRAPRMAAVSLAPREGHERDAGLTRERRATAFDIESAPDGARLLAFEDLQRGQCKWPLGDRHPFTFCGADVAGPREVDAGSRTRTGAKSADAGRPYCAHHRKLGTGV